MKQRTSNKYFVHVHYGDGMYIEVPATSFEEIRSKTPEEQVEYKIDTKSHVDEKGVLRINISHFLSN